MRSENHSAGHSIQNLQIMLRTIQLSQHKPCSVLSDGVYGPHTATAISDFQQTHNLPVTGITDAETWNLVVSDYETACIDTQCACPLKIRLKPNERICAGSRNPYISMIQSILLTLNRQFHCAGNPEISGVWDEQTVQSLSAFQKTAGLNCSGELDKQTWKHLALQYSLAALRCMEEIPEYS